MESNNSNACKLLLFLFVLICIEEVSASAQTYAQRTVPTYAQRTVLTCRSRRSPCFLKRIACPKECPDAKPSDPKAKACFLDCNSPKCETICRGRKPKCNGVGSGCYDPRFIGRDGVVFYFHGRIGDHFALVSAPNLQINARFIGLRPAGRHRDFTWIQALGILHGRRTLTVDAAKTPQWNDAADHFRFAFDGEPFEVPQGHLSSWRSPDGELLVERTGSRNSVTIAIGEMAEVAVSVVPVTEEDDRVHGYGIPPGDCFAHLEVQFRLLGLAAEVEGVVGRTYRPDFVSTAKAGVAMPVVGGEDKYRTSSLVAADCGRCLFSPAAED